MRVSETTRTIAGRISFNMALPRSGEVQCADKQVDRLDTDERNDDSAYTVDQQVAPQQRGGADRTIADAAQRQRNEGNDDQRIEDDRGQDRALRGRQAHDVK